MDEVKKEESEMTSPAAFVEGGIQEACDDACSICLEAFCDSDPSTVTSCKHEFHLQCVLEWCQRSSNCPMCWRPVGLNDPTSQELLEAVEHERSIRRAPSRNMPVFHHPTLVEFELQNLPVGVDDSELEERIMQHLAAAAAMGRTHRIVRGEGPRTRSSGYNTRPHLMVLSGNGSSASPNSSSLGHTEEETETYALGTDIISGSASRSYVIPNAHQGSSIGNRSNGLNQDSAAGPSEFQSPSDNWKSRFSSLSMKYKESISRNTRGWKEKLFSRSSSMAEIGSQVKRELNAGIATVSRMVERLETRENHAAANAPSANSAVNSPTSTDRSVNDNEENSLEAPPLDGNRSPNFATSSVSS